MTQKHSILILLTMLLFVSCKNYTNRTAATRLQDDSSPLPSGAKPFVYSRYIHISADVGCATGNFLLDIGARELLVDSIFYKENACYDFDTEAIGITGIGNETQYIRVIRDSVDLSFGDLSSVTTFVPILDLKSIGGDAIDGLVGTSFLEGKVLEIDYTKEYYKSYDSLEMVDLSGYRQIALEFIDGHYCIQLDIKIDEQTSLSGLCIIDTGSPISYISSAAAKAKNLESLIQQKVYYYTKYGGIGGESSSCEFIAPSIKLASHILNNVYMSFSLDSAGLMADDLYIGLIGNNILDRFNMVWDFIDERLYLEENENYGKPYIFDRLGFSHVDRSETKGGWIVTGLTKGSPAEQSGLEIDDMIVSVNEIPVEEISYKVQDHFFDSMNRLKLSVKSPKKIKQVEFKLAPLL